jgi:2-octaprenyl-6-methoxyphenol hydroxylase
MDTPMFDAAICGAGPVGSALALLLARKANKPERIALVGPTLQAPPPSGSGRRDPRTLALNYGSQVLLQELGAWPDTAAPIATVHVSQQGRLGRTLITPEELGVPWLGFVVGYDALLSRLHKALVSSGVTLIPATPRRTLHANYVAFSHDQQHFHGKLCIQCDGERPSGVVRHYNQHAVLATVRASQPRQGWAFERFTPEGPLAVLPHPLGQNTYGVVWCCSPQSAERLRSMDHDGFTQALNQAFGSRLGRLAPEPERHVFPLQLHAGPAYINARTVAIGNAAQTLHPVAGQGLNLGLRDAAQLAQHLQGWLSRPEPSPAAALQAYAHTRRPDRWLTAAVTDTLPRVFTTGQALVEHACGLALLGMDTMPGLRKPLARHLLQGLRL